MKKSKIIIPALAMLVMSTAATVTGTVAWFSANKNVYAEGMMVKAQAEGSLVITAGNHFPTVSDHASRFNFQDASATTLNPSTHAGQGGNSEVFGNTGLVKVSNGDQINPETGSQTGATALTYAAIASDANSDFYKDYTVYIAGDGNDLLAQDLVITISGVLSASTTGYINNAISIDFYCAATNTESIANAALVAESNFMGTLNLAGYINNADNKTRTQKQSIRYNGNAAGTGTGITINKTGSTNCLAVTMRVYFDGNLIEQEGTGSSVVAGTAYTTLAADTQKSTQTGSDYFYTDNGGYINYDAAPANVGGYKVVDEANSTYRYARSVSIADIRDVALSVDFSASNHQ